MLTWTSHQKFNLYINKRTKIEAKKKNPHSSQALTLNIFTHILKFNSMQQFPTISVMAETSKRAATTNKNTPLSMRRCNLATQRFFPRTFLKIAFSCLCHQNALLFLPIFTVCPRPETTNSAERHSTPLGPKWLPPNWLAGCFPSNIDFLQRKEWLMWGICSTIITPF